MSQIQSGELDQQVALYSSTSAQDSVGQPIKTWTLSDTVPARVDEAHGNETTQGNEITEKQPITVIIRGGSGVQTEWKLVYNSDTYRIVSVRRMGRDHWTEIKAVNVGDSESGN